MRNTDTAKPILLSPAGDFDTFGRVLKSGADAVYAAGPRFGARALARNFSDEELKEAIDICNLNGRRFFLTVNTLFRDDELSDVLRFIEPLYLRGLNGVIVQDMGAAMQIKRHFPGMSLHSSTQLGIYTPYGAKLLERAGFDLAVLPRELGLSEIRHIADSTDMELECFIHGALCFCYSGQCLLSSLIGARSGNRGYCAQPCRLPYTPVIDGKEAGKGYPLSLKDLCAYDSVMELICAGVNVLKIEGRMKSAEYAAGVTAIYRELIDGNGDAARDRQRLLALGSRSGFTNGYIKERVKDMVTYDDPSHFADKEAVNEYGGIPGDKGMKDPTADMKLSVYGNKPMELTVTGLGMSVMVEGDIAQIAKKRPMCEEDFIKSLSKTGGSGFDAGEISVSTDGVSFVPKGAINELRRRGLRALTDELLKGYKRSLPDISDTGRLSKNSAREVLGHSAARPGKLYTPDRSDRSGRVRDFAPCGSVFALVRDRAQLGAVLRSSVVTHICLDCHGFSKLPALSHLAREIKNVGKSPVYALPYVLTKDALELYGKGFKLIADAGFEAYLARCADELELICDMYGDAASGDMPFIIADNGIYTFNMAARDAYKETGVDICSVPLELNAYQLKERETAGDIMTVYGRYPVMITAQCVFNNTAGWCAKKDGGSSFYLKDRKGKLFPVRTLCDSGLNIIYNSVPACLFGVIDEDRDIFDKVIYRLDFSTESAGKTADVLAAFKERAIPDSRHFTYGHYKRGVK